MAATPNFGSSAKVIADSIADAGIRITSLQVRFPRMVLAEFNTHRVFSRNGRSSRAVPVATLLKEARESPYVPLFALNKPGMSPGDVLDPEAAAAAEAIWRDMAAYCANGVEKLNALKTHKQWANRPLEWFGYTDTLVTSTSWENFFTLRDHSAAQDEIRALAQAMKQAMAESTPRYLAHGDYHLPFISDEDRAIYDIETQLKLSTARSARISYKPFDGNDSIEKEMERYELLVGDQPMHASPAEHQATPDQRKGNGIGGTCGWWSEPLHGNFEGWIQHRKTLPGEYILEPLGL